MNMQRSMNSDLKVELYFVEAKIPFLLLTCLNIVCFHMVPSLGLSCTKGNFLNHNKCLSYINNCFLL